MSRGEVARRPPCPARPVPALCVVAAARPPSLFPGNCLVFQAVTTLPPSTPPLPSSPPPPPTSVKQPTRPATPPHDLLTPAYDRRRLRSRRRSRRPRPPSRRSLAVRLSLHTTGFSAARAPARRRKNRCACRPSEQKRDRSAATPRPAALRKQPLAPPIAPTARLAVGSVTSRRVSFRLARPITARHVTSARGVPIMSFHPQTPQSPCNFSPATSSDPMTGLSASSAAASTATLPTPAHSVNGCNSQPDATMSEESPHKRKRPLDDVGDRDRKKMHLEDRKLGIEDLHLDVGDKYLLCQTRKTALSYLCSCVLAGLRRQGLQQTVC